MLQNITIGKTKIRFKTEGQGKAVVLLHGYLESLEIWNDFAENLSERYNVISIDLPGHGESGMMSEVHSMEIMALSVLEVLNFLNIDKCTMFGHSMGGYVTMAFVEKFPERLDGFCLFHSAPYGDTDEKKQNRDREINIIRQGKKDQIYGSHFPKTFANDNVEKFGIEIEKATKIAKNMSAEAIIAVLEGMKTRKDRAELLKNTQLPFLYIIGKKDNFIPMEILEKLEMPKNNRLLVLENSGHNSFIEEPDEALKGVCDFLNENF